VLENCILCKEGKPHEYTYEKSTGLPYMIIHETDSCGYYLCKQLGNKCPSCTPPYIIPEDKISE